MEQAESRSLIYFCGFMKNEFHQRILKNEDGSPLPVNVSGLLEKTGVVKHFFAGRQGGVSLGVYESLNLSFTRGDNPEAVLENYRRVAAALGTNLDHIVCTDQTHTTNIRNVMANDRGKGITKPRDYTDVDGLITNEPGIALSVFTADCVPVMFADPVRRVIATAHSGWKGTAGGITEKVITKMGEDYGCDPKDIICAIGPCVCKKCYEVSPDVAEKFLDFSKVLPDINATKSEGYDMLSLRLSGDSEGYDLLQDCCKWEETNSVMTKKADGKFLLDLRKIVALTAKAAGVPEENIDVTELCTCCEPDRFFSHRYHHDDRGNMGAFIMLTD